MALEIERKFLTKDDTWKSSATGSARILQGYFARTPLLRARIRIYGDKGFITLKTEPGMLVRHEYEYEIPKADAIEMIKQFSVEPIITKVRYDVPYEGVVWAVDVFEGANSGLVMAEAELKTPDQVLALPPWAGSEVTNDRRYGNSNLARYPFITWDKNGNPPWEKDDA
ncbi:CYTH domain-containing protein [Hyphomicrobium sp.]|jgi:adenylate cyclase|uniref:CYTH domain-containing protein n=1 Tax=Hyphomicrobium sp. TaxID=82 RepID=UPI0035671541